MAKTYEITDFKKRETGAKEFITKFGGSPDWIKEEEWPLSLGWEDRKMTFVGQIYLKKDIGTKVEIQKLVLKLAAEGKSVTFISSEIDEMLRTCSRLIVMRDRKAVGELNGGDLTQSKIMATIAGGEE